MERNLRLLYAEDDRITADETAEYLQEEGFDVYTVHDGDSAWSSFRTLQPDIVLLDYQMPGKNGIEVFQLIHAVAPGTPVFILSSYTEYSIASLKVGATDFIRKDIKLEELSLRLKIAWERSRNTAAAPETEAPSAIYYLNEQCNYNAANHILYINNQGITLSGMLGELFTLLCRNQNHYVPIDTLCLHLWNITNPGKTSCLRDYISDLRKILSAAPSLRIHSKYRKGYCLETISH